MKLVIQEATAYATCNGQFSAIFICHSNNFDKNIWEHWSKAANCHQKEDILFINSIPLLRENNVVSIEKLYEQHFGESSNYHKCEWDTIFLFDLFMKKYPNIHLTLADAIVFA